MKILRGVLVLGLLCAAGHAQVEPLAVRTARERFTTAKADALRNYYRTLGIAAARSLRDKNTALQQNKDPAVVSAIAVEIKDLQAKVALYEAYVKGAFTVKIDARKDWQPALKVKAGSTIHVRAEGIWCINFKARAVNTCDANGMATRNSGFLEARIDEGRAFKVGKSSTFTATEDGELFFQIHDGPKMDNDGVLNVSIQVAPPTDIDKLPEDQVEALSAYYKSLVAAEEEMLKSLAAAMIPIKDPKVISTLSTQIDEIRQDLALHDALVNGKKGHKIHANKGWQSTINVKRGMTVHLRAVGVWCYANADRKLGTVDADGRPDNFYLEAKVGKQDQRAGVSCSFRVEEDGKLQLQMRDTVRADNDGAVTVYLSTDANPDE
jgi:hypothetical protein